MPLGGVSTGCIDIETDGTLGNCSVFGSLTPRRSLKGPFLGVAVDGKAYTMSLSKLPGVGAADDIHYWGHYPIADLEYEIDAPVSIALRAWSPFVVGDVEASTIPAAIFEVHLRNDAAVPINTSIVLSFSGSTVTESYGRGNRVILDASDLIGGGLEIGRATYGVFQDGALETSRQTSYVLGALTAHPVRTGDHLGSDASGWAAMATALPVGSPTSRGASVAVDFDLASGALEVVRFVLAWFTPTWRGSGTPLQTSEAYRQMHAKRFNSARDVAELIAVRHGELLARVIAWQQVVYDADELPGWLQDSLVNILHLITEDSVWAEAGPPLPDWVRPEDGLFGMNESPEICPQIECIPCSFYGNLPLVYFFPQLALSTLRGYVGYMWPDGAVPWIFGGVTYGTGPYALIEPTRGYQLMTNGPSFVDLVDRYWLRTGDPAVLDEFYPAVKLNTQFTMDLSRGPDGVVSMPDRPLGVPPKAVPNLPESEWLEAASWYGITAHAGGTHLAQLKMAERMAEEVGDSVFAEQCRAWFAQGSASIEDRLWVDGYYLKYLDPATGRRSDLVMANQADGSWMAQSHGLPGVFRVDRVAELLETVRRTCVPLTKYGAVNFANSDGTPSFDSRETGYGPFGVWVAEVMMLGMTYMYAGDHEFGLEIIRRVMTPIAVEHATRWEMPCMLDGETGHTFFGTDYYMDMMLWAVPAALAGQSLELPVQPGGLVDRMIAAGGLGAGR